MSREEVARLENVSFSYNGRPVLEGVELAIHQRDFVWIVGPNGGGKTTLLKLLLGLLKPTFGKVRVFGQDPDRARSRIGYMSQEVSVDRTYPVKVVDVVLLGRLGSGHGLGFFRRKDRRIALESLDQVGLADLAGRSVAELSGGEMRRMLIARALASRPEILLLDEPTANLDLLVQQELHRLLHELNESLTVVMVSHDPAFVSEFVEDVVCINRTCNVHPTAEFRSESLGELYGRPGMRMIHHDRRVGKRSEDA
jgi:zinc transport system ATP-binding protein